MNDLEKFLAEKFNKRYCCFTGSGTTAIYLILKSLNLKNRKILYPAITCMTPVNAAIYAGYEPVFCDVNLNNYTMDIAALESILEREKIGIIVPTHIYGHRCNMDAINKLARERNIFVLEDAAQSYYFGDADASIISFGHTKIFQTCKGGGAIFTDNEELHKKVYCEKEKISYIPFDVEKLFELYREEYYKILNEYTGKEMYKSMKELQLKCKDAFIYNMDYNDEIIKTISISEEIIKGRIERKQLYNKYLDKKYIEAPHVRKEDGLWRYTFLYNGDRDKLLYKVREQGIDISSWYMNLSKVYRHDYKNLPNASYLEKKIVNLWIDESCSEKSIIENIYIINSILKL